MRREIVSLSDHFTDAPQIFTTSPLYQSLCAVVAQDVPTLELLTRRCPGQQPSYLLFGAIHYLLLTGAVHPLSEFFPFGGRPSST